MLAMRRWGQNTQQLPAAGERRKTFLSASQQQTAGGWKMKDKK